MWTDGEVRDSGISADHCRQTVDSSVLLSGAAAPSTAAEQGQTSSEPHLLLLQRAAPLRCVSGSDIPKLTLKADICVGIISYKGL